MSATIITAELLKSAPFAWNIDQQIAPPQRWVSLYVPRSALYGNAVLAGAAALRCGSQLRIIASGPEISALALALPESTFGQEDQSATTEAVPCLLEKPQSLPQRAGVVAGATDGLSQDWISAVSQISENAAANNTIAGGWPQLKVLLADGSSFEPESRPAKDGPLPFVAGSEFVLAGVCSALLARGLSTDAAAVWGVYLMHLSLEAAAKDVGIDSVRAADLAARLGGSLRYATRHADANAAPRPGLRPR